MEIFIALFIILGVSFVLAYRGLVKEARLTKQTREILHKKQGSIVFFGDKAKHYKK